MLCNICKKNQAVIFSSKEENGKRQMEGLCIPCAKKLGINTDEILKQQNGAVAQMQANDLGKQIEGLMKSLADNLDGIDGIELNAIQFPNFNEQDDNNDDTKNKKENSSDDSEHHGVQPIFAGAFPLGSIFSSFNNMDFQNQQEGNTKQKTKQNKKSKKKKYLDTYGTNLTFKAKNNELDMVIGREKELERVIQILNRRSKNNPCLIGEPGVGKTAIANGLAIRIATQNVPAKLLNKEVYLLDLTSVLSGTQFRGQFEARMKGIINECANLGNIILVIDEIHGIIGAGTSGDNDSMNAANILKPALANGDIQLIGTTTLKEYRKYIEKDTALERRFQQVLVEEPSTDDSIGILDGIKKYYEDYHKVKISTDVIRQTVIMSEKYIHDRFLPDKAIDVLDEACSRINLKNIDLFKLEVLKNQLKAIQEQKEDAANADSTEDYQKAATLKTE